MFCLSLISILLLLIITRIDKCDHVKMEGLWFLWPLFSYFGMLIFTPGLTCARFPYSIRLIFVKKAFVFQSRKNHWCAMFLTFDICRYEEYIDYLFPEETQTTNLKILEAAYRWKKQKTSED